MVTPCLWDLLITLDPFPFGPSPQAEQLAANLEEVAAANEVLAKGAREISPGFLQRCLAATTPTNRNMTDQPKETSEQLNRNMKQQTRCKPIPQSKLQEQQTVKHSANDTCETIPQPDIRKTKTKECKSNTGTRHNPETRLENKTMQVQSSRRNNTHQPTFRASRKKHRKPKQNKAKQNLNQTYFF